MTKNLEEDSLRLGIVSIKTKLFWHFAEVSNTEGLLH